LLNKKSSYKTIKLLVTTKAEFSDENPIKLLAVRTAQGSVDVFNIT
jgi:hypothetical protein